ncbi:MAG: NAD(P)-dependent oxidoreductase [bacterium]|nr:NAD(P)-dependent oxidoreductase [bacterium]
MKRQVGLVGCGLMGAPIAARLVDCGYNVVVFDKSAAALESAHSIGCATAVSPRQVAETSRVVLISLPRPEHVTDVVRGSEDCLLAGMAAGSVIVDTSTVDPTTSKENARAAAELGVGYLDCPILGRPAGCGNWTLPAGGDPEHLRTVTPVLEAFASRVVHIGPSGHGNTLKLLNNLMFGAINSVTAEMFALAERVGMEPGLLFDTIVHSGAGTVSNLFKELGPKVVAEEFTPNFTVSNLHKDVGLGLAMADAAGIDLEISKAGQRLNEKAQAAGLGDEDTAAVFKALISKEQRSEAS